MNDGTSFLVMFANINKNISLPSGGWPAMLFAGRLRAPSSRPSLEQLADVMMLTFTVSHSIVFDFEHILLWCGPLEWRPFGSLERWLRRCTS